MRRWYLIAAIVVLIAAVLAAFAYARAQRSLATATGDTIDRAVPRVPLVDQNGRTVMLANFRGKVVVLAPTLTLCSEVCPITTGSFIRMQAAVRRAGMADRVAFVLVTVDPLRDTPARLRAYQRLTGVRSTFLTGSAEEVKRFWSFFGVGYFQTPQGNPPARDWLTGRPLTYDVAHSDGVFFLDARGHERIVMVGPPTTGGTLSAQLRRLLSDQGLRNLAHPHGAWTVEQALNDISNLLGTRVGG